MSEQPDEPDKEHASFSLPVIVATAVFALVAIAVVGFLLSSRDDDPDPQIALPEALDLAAPLYQDGSTEFRLHLVVDDVNDGENDIAVRFTQGGDALETFDPGVEGVDLALVPLDNADEAQSMALVGGEDGQYETGEPVELHDGWWETTITMYPSDSEARSTIFYLLVPDPNLHERDDDERDSDEAAQGFYEAGLAQMASTHSIKYIERLATGQGMASIVQREVTDGNGDEAASHSINAQFELMTVDDRSFQRTPGGEWIEREYLPVFPVSEWVTLYEGATSFALAESVMINDRATQIITFYVPPSDLAAAHYAWWVDVETGYVVREAMISTWHYMIYEFGEFNQPLQLAIPISEASPAASPVASPIGS